MKNSEICSETKARAKRYVYNFLQDKEKWNSIQDGFLENYLIYQFKVGEELQLSIFTKKIKDIYCNFVNDEDFTEEDLSNILKLLIKNNQYLNFNNVKKMKTAIDGGIYDEELKLLKIQLELQDLDWGIEEWEI